MSDDIVDLSSASVLNVGAPVLELFENGGRIWCRTTKGIFPLDERLLELESPTCSDEEIMRFSHDH